MLKPKNLFSPYNLPKNVRFFSSSLLNGTSRPYVESLYRSWLKDSSAVDPSWNSYFANLSQQNNDSQLRRETPNSTRVDLSFKLDKMIKFFRDHGHQIAQIDPLEIQKPLSNNARYSLDKFETENFGIDSTAGRTDVGEIPLSPKTSKIFESTGAKNAFELKAELSRIYCSAIGFEFDHIEEEAELDWLREKVESQNFTKFDLKAKNVILNRLAWACKFEKFLNLKWSAQKRFGLEGTEAMIPGIKEILDTTSALGVENLVIGMPHRGRLNVLVNVLKKPLDQMLAEFAGTPSTERLGGTHSGDVKYHMGHSTDRVTRNGNSLHISLVANPSHLEACNTLVLGKTRAKQDLGNKKKNSSMALLIHGDAAFYGQGIVYETLMMNDFKGFDTQGTIHVICNNQIGYTTDPIDTRKSKYCSNVAKSFGAPIIHVNAENTEAVVAGCRLAAEYRQKFAKDVVIDIVGYRRHGHNEGDEPRFTQPKMYQQISALKDPFSNYAAQLLKAKEASVSDVEELEMGIRNKLEMAFKKSKNIQPVLADWLEKKWSGFHHFKKLSTPQKTGVDLSLLQKVGEASMAVPPDFSLHPRLKKFLETRRRALASGENIDWGLAEALAFGSILSQGFPVRLSGQDVERGTFSHRHAVLVDQKSSQRKHYPLQAFKESRASFKVLNSPLSEYGVLGFEYGYSLESPNSLVLWEAQFGDFSNHAQAVFDQFISSAESKWLRQSGIVVLLPHGYEGGGPEHSSARIERFLQMCDDDSRTFPLKLEERAMSVQKCNWQVLNCSTPANYFHALRRQVCRNFRKPLILFSPKSLLKLRECVSSLSEMSGDSFFQWVLPEREELAGDEKVRRVLICSGKVFYDLAAERKRLGVNDVAIITLEQLSPFPYIGLLKQMEKYRNSEIVWVQEEPMNMGPYSYVSVRIIETMKRIKDRKEIQKDLKYVGRPPSAATATGFGMKEHLSELKSILNNAFDMST